MTPLHLDVRVPPELSENTPALVFAHGAMDRHTSFDRVRRRFPNHITAAYDRRGYAGSVHRAPGLVSPFADHLDDLLEVIDTTEVIAARPVLLVGHSYGSNVVIGAAVERPDQVVGIVGYEPPMPWTSWWPTTAGGSTIEAGREGGPAAAAESFMRRVVGDRIWERLPEATKQARRDEGQALLDDLGSLRGRPCPVDHSACHCPAVIGYGALSLPHQQRSARETVELLPAGELVELADTPHGAHTMNPDGFVSLIQRVLERVPEPT